MCLYTLEETAFPGGIGVRIAKGGATKVAGVPISNDALGVKITVERVRDGGAEQLVNTISRMTDYQSTNLIATISMVQRTSYIERVVDPELSV